MAYIAPIHAPSSVRHAIRLAFLEPDQQCLIVAKANRLEIYSQGQDGLTLKHAKAVYGRVTMLHRLKPLDSSTDQLFVGTDRYMYFVLSWDPVKRQLHTQRSYVDQADKFSRDSQTGDRCAIDPSHSFMALELFEGIVNIVPFTKKPKKPSDPPAGSLLDPIPVRIPEMFVRSSAFLETRAGDSGKPKLALLYEDSQKRVRLRIRELEYQPGLHADDTGNVELKDIPEGFQETLETGSSHLIPVSQPACGVLILAETSLMYFEPSSQDRIRRPLQEATIFVAWEQIDSQRFILADEYGRLYLLMLEIENSGKVTGWQLDQLGETSRASTLVYLGEGLVYVGSHQGDSQIISIKPKGLDVVQTFANIAPILDFAIMDMGNRSTEGQSNEFSSGQARLVTGSGAFRDGSLRSVRSGVGLEDLAVLDALENTSDMFSLKSSASQSHVDVLIISLIADTRVFRFGADGDVEELSEFRGFHLQEPTLYAASVAGDRLLQVTPTAVTLSDSDSGMIVAEWSPKGNSTITACSGSRETLVVSVDGLSLLSLDLSAELKVQAEQTFGQESQVACVGVSPCGYPVCVVGFWSTASISVLDLKSLKSIHEEKFTGSGLSLPRSIALVDALEGQPPTLFLAMADGHVVTYSFDPQIGTLSGRKSVVLGTQEASFKALPRNDGLYNIFATSEHASLIYGSEGRLVFSAITVEKASSVCSFDAQGYEGAIAIAAEDGLKISLIDQERSSHVQGLAFNETVRRIAYSPELKAFGLGTIKRTLEDGVEVVKSHFKLADEVMFQVLASYEFNQEELVESVMRCQLNDGTGGLVERFVVGTAYLDEEFGDSVRGRIVVLEVTEDRKLKVVTEHEVKGACRCLAMLGDRIVAALIKTVVVYSLDYETPSTPFLTKHATFRTSTAPIDLSIDVANSRIAVADLMKSVSVLQYKKAANTTRADSLTEIARHFQTSWATAVAQVSSTEDDPAPLISADGKPMPTTRYLEADAEGNLILLNQTTDAALDEDNRRLVIVSEINLGEMVNRIRPISVGQVSEDAPVVPRAFLATTEGSIYLFALIVPSKRDLLIRLQGEMAAMVKSPGFVPFDAYRGFRSIVRTEKEPVRFVDGELVEQFLFADDAVQQDVANRLGQDLESLRSVVENLRRLR